MAELRSNSLLLRVDILSRFHIPGDPSKGPDEGDWLNAQVTYAVGERVILQIDLPLQASAAEEFYRGLVKLIHKRCVQYEECWGHLGSGMAIYVWRSDTAYNASQETDEQLRNYEFLFILQEGSFDPLSRLISPEGPAMYFQPKIEDILAFAKDLRSEAEITRLLDS